MFGIYIKTVPVVAVVLMVINYFFSVRHPYEEKDGPFECGFTSYYQTRSAFSVAFILVAMLFLPFDTEMSSLLPFMVNPYDNGQYGLVIYMLFINMLVSVFVVEVAINALKIDRQFNQSIKLNNLYEMSY
uniref:NADH-ubiquinone oxidoreductase chain 3 n=1 Tax=Candida bohioensis TaxID=561986 RepID=U3MGM2_9ASCO|nr:NADH dehydrogenase subunit 3 [Candida bohioensis]AGW07359.1 NADH dehydrogenase subunit 3 [Candida bohioensis]